MRAASRLAMLGLLGLAACGRGGLPDGKDFAGLEAPLVQAGLDAYRQGDDGAMLNAADGLNAIAKDETETGAAPCSREAYAAQNAAQAAVLLQKLAHDRFIHDSDDTRFVVLGKAVDDEQHFPPQCTLAAALALEQLFPAGTERPLSATQMYYGQWRAQLAARLGNEFQPYVRAAEDRVAAYYQMPRR